MYFLLINIVDISEEIVFGALAVHSTCKADGTLAFPLQSGAFFTGPYGVTAAGISLLANAVATSAMGIKAW